MLLPILASATSEPVMCITIFQGKGLDVPSGWKSGIDICLLPVRDTSQMGHCVLTMERISRVLCTLLKEGEINDNILVDVLRALDEVDVFPRVPRGLVPVLIIDGHKLQLDPKFLMYINDAGHI
jgi:hypothetical protein